MSADSNAIAVILLRELADAEQFVANASGAARLRAAADTLSGALQALWRHDHFASQIGVDGSEKDWVDNDANFLAIAAGAATPTQAAAFAARFGRGMGGRCKRPTWVVERPPCGTGANGRRVECPDARVSEARVAWTEALARDVMGDTAALRTRLVEPLRTDVLCHNCAHAFEGIPIMMPTRRCARTGRFEVQGVFCSFNCAKRRANEVRHNNMEVVAMVHQLHRRVVGVHARIVVAPPRTALKVFGGYMDIAQYREGFQQLPPTAEMYDESRRKTIVAELQRHSWPALAQLHIHNEQAVVDERAVGKRPTAARYERTKPLRRSTLNTLGVSLHVVPRNAE